MFRFPGLPGFPCSADQNTVFGARLRAFLPSLFRGRAYRVPCTSGGPSVLPCLQNAPKSVYLGDASSFAGRHKYLKSVSHTHDIRTTTTRIGNEGRKHKQISQYS